MSWRAAAAALALTSVLGIRVGANDNWPQFRGPGGRGVANSPNLPETWSETENVRWKTPIPGLAARGESPASHRDRRGTPLARRDDREYREYLREKQRSQRGCIAGRMQLDFHHGLLGEFSMATPAIARDSLIIRTARHLYRIGGSR